MLHFIHCFKGFGFYYTVRGDTGLGVAEKDSYDES